MSHLVDGIRWRCQWTLHKYHGPITPQSQSYETVPVPGNLALNAGIGVVLNLIIETAATTGFGPTHARLGVGDSSTAEAAGQTGLQAGANKTYKAMNASKPSISGQTMTFEADFAPADANYAWNEVCVDNGTTTLNRKVSGLGTKPNTDTWRLQCAITLA